MIRFASKLPKDSPEKKVILAGLSQASADPRYLELTRMVDGFVSQNLRDLEEYTISAGLGPYDSDVGGFLSRLCADRNYAAYTVEDLYRVAINSEEIDPRVSEDAALRAMARIRRKYQ